MIKLRLFFKGFHKGMRDFGEIISSIINSIVLLIVYLLGVGITSIFAKILRKKFLETKISKNRDSYWSDINFKNKQIEDYYKQF